MKKIQYAGIAAVSAVLLAAYLVCGINFALSCCILALVYAGLKQHISRFSTSQKWLLGVGSAVLAVPASPWLTLLVAGSFATIVLYKDICPQSVYMTAMAAIAFFAGTGVLLPDLALAAKIAEATDTSGTSGQGLATTLTSLETLADNVTAAVPYLGGAIGMGFGCTGLIEIVKSKNGQGGDLGDGIKKLLIGGALTGVSSLVGYAKTDVVGSGS